MKEKELQAVAKIISDIVSGDCDICPCSRMIGDKQECSRVHGEECLQAIKRRVKEAVNEQR